MRVYGVASFSAGGRRRETVEDVVVGNYGRIGRKLCARQACRPGCGTLVAIVVVVVVVPVQHDALRCARRASQNERVEDTVPSVPSRRGRTESASGISLGSTGAPTAPVLTSKMESNAPRDESG